MEKPLHIIDENSNFLQDEIAFNESLKDMQINSNKYIVIAISGAQSSGKSTFFNHLLSTSFETLNIALNGFRRTTRGLHLAPIKRGSFSYPLLVLDAEGTDSSDRREENYFDSQLALFSLSVSHVFLCNLWFHDVGRHSASGAFLFERIIQVSVQAFEPMKKVWLVFLVRDHEKDLVSAEKLKTLLLGGLKFAWKKASENNETWQNKELEDVFDCEIFCLPKFFVVGNDQKNCDFFAAVGDFREALKQRILDASLTESITGLKSEFDTLQQTSTEIALENKPELKRMDFVTNVPLADLHSYWKSLWEKIKTHKDLNLPNERKLLAIARCKDILDEVLMGLKNATKYPELLELNQLKDIIADVFRAWEKETKFYDRDVVQEFHQKMDAEVERLVSVVFDHNFEQLKNRVTKEIKTIFAGKERISEFEVFVQTAYEAIEEKKVEFINRNSIELENGRVFKIDRKKVEDFILEMFIFHFENFRSVQQKLIVAKISEQMTTEFVETALTKLVCSIDANFWFSVSALENKAKEEIGHCLERELLPLFSLPQSLSFLRTTRLLDVVFEEEISVFNKLQKELQHSIFVFAENSLRTQLIRVFEQAFLFDEESLPRRFSSIKEARNKFSNAKDKMLALLEILVSVPKGVSVFGNDKGLRILSEKQEFELKEHLMAHAAMKAIDVENVVDARNARIKGVSPLLYLLLLFLGWNKLVYLLRRPFLLFFVLFAVVLLFMAKKSNDVLGFWKFDQLKRLINEFKNKTEQLKEKLKELKKEKEYKTS